VLVGAGDHVGAAADHRLQRFRAAGEIRDLDLEPLVLEVALALRDRERQVVEQALAAHRDRDLLLLRRLGPRARGHEQRGGRGQEPHRASNRHGIPLSRLCVRFS
jgi:hypothetical protein